MLNANAQIGNTPELEKFVTEYGQQDFIPIIMQLRKSYTALLKDSDKKGVRVVRDISYGTDERHKLEIFQPATASDQVRPVMVFIHGGGYVQGNKQENEEIYANIGHYFARNGVLTLIANYRLAPKNQWPAGIEDMAAIIRWINGNIREYGGDPRQIFLMGQSAGAGHVASYVFHDSFHVNNGDDGVAGAILVSGPFELTGSNTDVAYFGEDRSKWPERDFLNHVDGRKIPLFIIDVEYDPISIQLANVKLMQKVCERDGTCPRRMHVQGHNHISGIYHINTADDSYGREILDFIHSPKSH